VGVVAVRRAGLIVALVALLGMLVGAGTASPALADGRGGPWTFDPSGSFSIPAGFCPFQVDVTQPGMVNTFEKGVKAPDGATAVLINGVADFTFTNDVTGKSISTRDSGNVVQTSYPDGSFTAVQHGNAWVGLPAALTAQFGFPAVFVSTGKLTISFDANGNLSMSLHGRVTTNICAALS
jgi:hypothetical protein